MTLGDKLRQLRDLEGQLRGFDRPLTQSEVVRAIKRELGKTVSQSYLSLVENGARRHLSDDSRQLLAKFFKVHPGYLVNDPPGFQTELRSRMALAEDPLTHWLIEGATRYGHDPALAAALRRLAHHPDSRGCLVLLGEMTALPDLIARLSDTLFRKDPA